MVLLSSYEQQHKEQHRLVVEVEHTMEVVEHKQVVVVEHNLLHLHMKVVVDNNIGLLRRLRDLKDLSIEVTPTGKCCRYLGG